jgi:DNA-directed RNA polymerase subunit RPC12/RpoP
MGRKCLDCGFKGFSGTKLKNVKEPRVRCPKCGSSRTVCA